MNRSGRDDGRRARAGQKAQTHWGDVAGWYDELVGDSGSEYQREVIFPGVLRLLELRPQQRVLDLACGQGVFCRVLRERGVRPIGLDASAELVRLARQRSGPDIEYVVADARRFALQGTIAAATCILAIQNIDSLPPVFESVSRALDEGGRLVLVMMHPCFRSPEHTTWGWDETAGVQYRRVERYLLPRKHPIFTHPGKKTGQYTWTFHRPLEVYIKALRRSGLLVDALEEWPSHKTSTSGPRARAENVARKEVPLFLALRAVKLATRGSGDEHADSAG